MADTPARPQPADRERGNHTALRYVEDALRGLQYGAVTIIVQDGVIVQVERTERRRFRQTARKA
jgi:hypothetical protein